MGAASIPCNISMARSNAQNIPGIFQKLLDKLAVAHVQDIQGNIPPYAAVNYVFIPFLIEYSRNT